MNKTLQNISYALAILDERKIKERRTYLAQFYTSKEIDEIITDETKTDRNKFIDEKSLEQIETYLVNPQNIVLLFIALTCAIRMSTNIIEFAVLFAVFGTFALFLSISLAANIKMRQIVNSEQEKLANEYVKRNPEKYTIGRAKNFVKNLVQFRDK